MAEPDMIMGLLRNVEDLNLYNLSRRSALETNGYGLGGISVAGQAVPKDD